MLNNLTLQGRLVKDIEIRTTNGGAKIANFTLAVERNMKDASGNKPTDFIPCTAFNKAAEIINQFVHKGDMIIVNGPVQTSSYEKNGNKVYTYACIVNEFNFLPRTSSGTTEAPTAPAPTTAPTTAPDMNAPTAPELKIDVDNLPFDF